MALKVKGKAAKTTLKRKGGIPKAGPKKRRATEEERKAQAIAEHTTKPSVGRRAGKVKKYTYKEETPGAKKKRADAFVAEQERVFGLRMPKPPTPFEAFKDELPEDAKVFARMYWQMQCEHEDEVVASTSSLDGVEPVEVRCKRCGLLRRWQGTKSNTKLQEWVSYCPDGYDMLDWIDLFCEDRSLWQFIHDEVLAEQMEGVIA